METTRITVKTPDNDAAEAFKERFFKLLYQHQGTTVIFETPVGDDAADEILAAAKEAGHEAEKETHEDPLEDAEPVDFW